MTKPSRSSLLIIVLGTLALVLLAVWIIPRIERYTETIDLGFSAEAYQNPYLAAQKYLQELGKPAASSDSLESMRQLPGIETSLVIDDVSRVLSEERTHELLEWVRSGGRLIMGARDLEEEEVDYILQTVGVEVFETECDCRDFEDELTDAVEDLLGKRTADKFSEEAENIKQEINAEAGMEVLPESTDSVPEDQLTKLYVSATDDELTLYFDPNRGLWADHWDWEETAEEGDVYYGYEPIYWAGSSYAEHFLQFEIGEGLLTILSDESIWFSENLADYDHAYLLWALHRHSADVLFVYGSRMPGLFTLLWRNAPQLIISFVVLLIVWLVYKGRRFGPVLAEDNQQRRALIEHQRAVGHFMWQQGQAAKLVELMRDDLKQRLHLRCPDFDQKTPREQAEFLEHTLDVSDSVRVLALDNQEQLNAELFTAVTAAIQTIRNRL